MVVPPFIFIMILYIPNRSNGCFGGVYTRLFQIRIPIMPSRTANSTPLNIALFRSLLIARAMIVSICFEKIALKIPRKNKNQ